MARAPRFGRTCFAPTVQYRLGVPLLKEEIDCPVCMQKKIDISGDHATCCSRTGDLVSRHNALRDMVDNLASQGMLSPVMEKKGILGSQPGRRPGDVTIPQLAERPSSRHRRGYHLPLHQEQPEEGQPV